MENKQWKAPLWIFGDALFATAWVVAAKSFFVHTGTHFSVSILVLILGFAVTFQGAIVAATEKSQIKKKPIPDSRRQWILVFTIGAFVALTEYFLLLSFVYNANLGYSAILVVGIKAIVVNFLAKKIFKQYLSSKQWLGVWLGIFASCLVAFHVVAKHSTREEEPNYLGIPIWLVFVLLMNISNLIKEICSRKQFESMPVGSGIMWTGIFMIPASIILCFFNYEKANLPSNFVAIAIVCSIFHGACVFCRTKAKWLQVNPFTHESLRFAYGLPMKMFYEAYRHIVVENDLSKSHPIFAIFVTLLSMLSAFFVIPSSKESDKND